MGTRAGLDGCGKSRPAEIRSPDRPARSTHYTIQAHATLSYGTKKFSHEGIDPELLHKRYTEILGGGGGGEGAKTQDLHR